MGLEPSEDYARDEIDEIFRLALKKQMADNQRASRLELLDVARSMGIDTALVDQAIAQYEKEGRMARARAIWRRRQRSEFRETLRAFCIFMPILVVVDFYTGGGWWFHWPLLGWGIILFIEAGEAFWPSEKEVDVAAKKLLKRPCTAARALKKCRDRQMWDRQAQDSQVWDRQVWDRQVWDRRPRRS